MKKMYVLRDIVIAVVLGALALFLIGYVKEDKTQEHMIEDNLIVEEEVQEEDTEKSLTTGVSGVVLVGPQCPATQGGEECPDIPFSEGVVDILVDDPERELIARVPLDANGRFGATLPSGAFVLVVQHGGTFPICDEEHITVADSAVTERTIVCDSGIQ